jgi:hypothetical protein
MTVVFGACGGSSGAARSEPTTTTSVESTTTSTTAPTTTTTADPKQALIQEVRTALNPRAISNIYRASSTLTDGQGYTWKVEAAWGVADPTNSIQDAPPGQVDVSFKWATVVHMTNTTPGRNAAISWSPMIGVYTRNFPAGGGCFGSTEYPNGSVFTADSEACSGRPWTGMGEALQGKTYPVSVAPGQTVTFLGSGVTSHIYSEAEEVELTNTLLAQNNNMIGWELSMRFGPRDNSNVEQDFSSAFDSVLLKTCVDNTFPCYTTPA